MAIRVMMWIIATCVLYGLGIKMCWDLMDALEDRFMANWSVTCKRQSIGK